MRIVGGKFKRRLIEFPEENNADFETRPTKDRIREAIFSALGNDMEGEVVLDLFAGSGSLGLEALSRNAKQAYFVDASKAAIQAIQHNVQLLDIKNATILKKDYQKALEYFLENHIQFSLVFLDPPYKMDVYLEILDFLEKHDLLLNSARIVLESDHPIMVNSLSYSARHYQYGFIHVQILSR